MFYVSIALNNYLMRSKITTFITHINNKVTN